MHYYLKYCTVNSQAKNRIIALDAGKRGVGILKSLLSDLKDPKMPICSESTSEIEINDLRSLLSNLKMFKDEVLLS